MSEDSRKTMTRTVGYKMKEERERLSGWSGFEKHQ